jgi:putative glutamine amidotransferase
MKPLIGISVDYADPDNKRTGGKLQLNWNYAQSVADAGGIPILLPPQADATSVMEVIDGLLIPGGDDIDASHWGEENHPAVKPISKLRFESEERLYGQADPALPILGICYGCQFVNVVRGGSLIQHLPDITGDAEHVDGAVQKYEIEPDSHLGGIVGTKVEGQSWHHQAVDRVGANLRVVAREADGTVEAIEAEDRPWLIGVQWHPERTPDDVATKKLMSGFIAAAAAYHERKHAQPVAR